MPPAIAKIADKGAIDLTITTSRGSMTGQYSTKGRKRQPETSSNTK